MKKVNLNLTAFNDRKEIHCYLKDMLEFPEYYGGNLDALYDCLTDIQEDTAIGILEDPSNTPDVARYLRSLNGVFEDAEEENRHLAVFIFVKENEEFE